MRKAMVLMMSGNRTKVIVGLFAVGFLLGKVKANAHKNSFKDTEVKPNVAQYINRLSEFFIDDLEEGKSDFFELLDMGFSANDCFEIIIAKKSFV